MSGRLVALWIGSIAITIVITSRFVHEPVSDAPTNATPTVAIESTGRAASSRQITALETPALGRPKSDGAFVSAVAQLEADLADGRWSIADRDRLNIALLRVNGPQAKQLIAMLFPKLNSRQVISDIDGPPL